MAPQPSSTRVVDLTNCEREPIHTPGSIQPHGCLLILREPDLAIAQASENTEAFLGRRPDELLGTPFETLLTEHDLTEFRRILRHEWLEASPLYVATHTRAAGQPYNILVHRREGTLVVELEPATSNRTLAFPNLYPLVRTSISRLQSIQGMEPLCQQAAEEVQRLSGFHKVMIYQFDESWNGTVVAEARSGEEFPAYLGLHFPASDIPRQARELYLLNRLRLIVDAEYRPIPISPALNPITGRTPDLTYSTLRSVSPVHTEYLRNMEVRASMSVSIIIDNQLWGLIALHHHEPRFLPYDVRIACDFLGQVLAMQISATRRHEAYLRRMRLKDIQARLLGRMAAEEDFVAALSRNVGQLLALTQATGVALLFSKECVRLGETPDEQWIRRLVDHLHGEVRQDVFTTDALAGLLPGGLAPDPRATGVLAVSISKVEPNYLIWFRPEVVRTLVWGGDPEKPATADPNLRLHPRTSFEQWKQTVRGRSLPWDDAEVEAAGEFRNAIIGIVLKRAEEMAALTTRLEQANKELEAFSYSVSHDLRAPFRHIVGFSDLLLRRGQSGLDETSTRYIKTIAESARYAGTLVDALLAFSQMGRVALRETNVEMTRLVEDVRRDVEQTEGQGRRIEWTLHPLPAIHVDPTMLRLTVRNLLSNAVKYTRRSDPARIEVGSRREAGQIVFWVQDNGVGFDMRYADKLFGVFQRLHRAEDFEGTGVGLANVRRVIERHGGRVWAESVPGQGATFYFSIPDRLAQPVPSP